MSRLIRVISASYFSLPVLKYLKSQIVLSYPYNYEFTTRKDFRGILKGPTANLREILSVKSADVIIASTRELQNKLKNKYGRNSVVIPNFLDSSKFYPRKKKKHTLYAGRIFWYKGLDFLIEAFKDINKEFPNEKLIIAGTGDIEFYREKSKKMAIQNIQFLGVVDNLEMPKLMGKTQIFVLPTIHREGHPKALIEAMASGCACIATNVPGNRDLIKDNENGLLIKSKDTPSVVEAIKKILANKHLKAKLSKNAIRTAKQFSVEFTLHKEIHLVKNLMKDI